MWSTALLAYEGTPVPADSLSVIAGCYQECPLNQSRQLPGGTVFLSWFRSPQAVSAPLLALWTKSISPLPSPPTLRPFSLPLLYPRHPPALKRSQMLQPLLRLEARQARCQGSSVMVNALDKAVVPIYSCCFSLLFKSASGLTVDVLYSQLTCNQSQKRGKRRPREYLGLPIMGVWAIKRAGSF